MVSAHERTHRFFAEVLTVEGNPELDLTVGSGFRATEDLALSLAHPALRVGLPETIA